MATKPRSHPVIPDHDVLRKIGGGAYGEVWMARGVTGALRAVKVVWREDFDDERSFEREFEGILKFEPISRDHPGLVNILHVGRSPDGVSFYYYVMELGDDLHTGSDINPIEYEPRTLRQEGKAAGSHRLETGLCIDVGLRLSEALGHLHERGLAHRDVKPSNVIFVNGKAKLADIGLVAARDQRTFVGTEGFVPPEGPGSAQADMYSLGKVLYEIATGKDRLDFPELPDELPTGLERKRWLELNRVICDVCEPRISKRRITTAAALADALRRLQRGKRRRSGASIWATTLILLGFSSWGIWMGIKDSEWAPWNEVKIPPVVAELGMLRVVSAPEGAEVFDSEGLLIGITPTTTLRAKVGTEVSYVVRKKGYRPLEIRETVNAAAASEPQLLFRELQVFSPPVIGEVWEDHLGNPFHPASEEHVAAGFVTRENWEDFIEVSKREAGAVEFVEVSQYGEPVEVVLAPVPEMIAYCDWFRVGGIRDGYLTNDYEVFGTQDSTFENSSMSDRARREGLRPFRITVREYIYGGVQLVSDPPGADVYMNGRAVGQTSESLLLIPKVKPGSVELLLVLEGYKPHTLNAEVKPGENLPMRVVLEENQGVVFGAPWVNGIEMSFAPLGPDLMVSIWETRVGDYGLFVSETEVTPPRSPDFVQTADHPVVFVSREDAEAFCEWLTKRERDEERIARSHHYRLPTDREWSRMVGLMSEQGATPSLRDANKSSVFQWGAAWPPSDFQGNFADTSAASLPGISPERTIPGYQDGHPRTAPVGSFSPNEHGIFDLSGNVHEWVADDYSITSGKSLGIARGGGWNSYLPENLYLGSRSPVPTTQRDAFYGFRVVLAKLEQSNGSPEINIPNP